MKKELFSKVKSKEALIILADDSGKIIWQCVESPVAKLFEKYFKNEFLYVNDMTLYANQAGIAMGLITSKIPVKKCYAVKMSEGGLEEFNKNGVSAEYEEQIPFVHSSKDDNNVCPVELYLYEHKNEEQRWDFLKERFSKVNF